MRFENKPAKWSKGRNPLPDYLVAAGWKSGERPSSQYLNWHVGTFYEAIEELQEKAGIGLKSINNITANEDGNLVINTELESLLKTTDLERHVNSKIYNTGVHGLRVKNGFLQYQKDDGEWYNFNVDDYRAFRLPPIEEPLVIPLYDRIGITWGDPDDVIIEGETVAEWSHTVIVRQEGRYPENINDGVAVVSNSVSNQYSYEPFYDLNVGYRKMYYYKAFAYSKKGMCTISEMGATYLEREVEEDDTIYGIEIDLYNSHPESAVTYIEDSIRFIGGDIAWNQRFPFNRIKPVYLVNGEVVAELDPKDFTKDRNGNPIDITGAGRGDVMIEFPKMYWKIEKGNGKIRVLYCKIQINETWAALAHTRDGKTVDNIYIGAYLAKYNTDDNGNITRPRSTSGAWPDLKKVTELMAFANAENVDRNYMYANYHQYLMLQILFFVRYKTLDSTSILGTGQLTDVLPYDYDETLFNELANPICGIKDKSGMISPSKDFADPVKFLGLENLFGLTFTAIDGLYVGNNQYELIGENFDQTQVNKVYAPDASAFDSSSYYLKEVVGTNDMGFLPHNSKKPVASSSTYYKDAINIRANSFLTFGGLVEQSIGSDASVPQKSGMASLDNTRSDSGNEKLVATRAVYMPGIYEFEYSEDLPTEITGGIAAYDVIDNSPNNGTLLVDFKTPNKANNYHKTYLYHIEGKQFLDPAFQETFKTALRKTMQAGALDSSGGTDSYDLGQNSGDKLITERVRKEIYSGGSYNEKRYRFLGTGLYDGNQEEYLFNPEHSIAIVSSYTYGTDRLGRKKISFLSEPIFMGIDLIDEKPPEMLQYFLAASEGFDSISLYLCTHGDDGNDYGQSYVSDHPKVKVVMKKDALPQSLEDGELVFEGRAKDPAVGLEVIEKGIFPGFAFYPQPPGAKITVPNLETNIDYYFRAWLMDDSGNTNDQLKGYINSIHRSTPIENTLAEDGYFKNYVIGRVSGYPAPKNLKMISSLDGLNVNITWENFNSAYDLVRYELYVATEDISKMHISELRERGYRAYNGLNTSYVQNSIPGSTYYGVLFPIYNVDGIETVGSKANAFVVATDTEGPGLLSNFAAFGMNETKIFVSWTNPPSADHYKTKIVMKAYTPPRSMTDGEVIYEGNGTSQIVHNLVENTEYHFRAFTEDTKGNISSDDVPAMYTKAIAEKVEEVKDLILWYPQNADGVHAKWTPPSNSFFTRVELFVSESPEIEFRTLDECRATDTMVFEGLSNQTVHYFTNARVMHHYKVFTVYNFFGTVIVSNGYYNFFQIDANDLPPVPNAPSSIVFGGTPKIGVTIAGKADPQMPIYVTNNRTGQIWETTVNDSTFSVFMDQNIEDKDVITVYAKGLANQISKPTTVTYVKPAAFTTYKDWASSYFPIASSNSGGSFSFGTVRTQKFILTSIGGTRIQKMTLMAKQSRHEYNGTYWDQSSGYSSGEVSDQYAKVQIQKNDGTIRDVIAVSLWPKVSKFTNSVPLPTIAVEFEDDDVALISHFNGYLDEYRYTHNMECVGIELETEEFVKDINSVSPLAMGTKPERFSLFISKQPDSFSRTLIFNQTPNTTVVEKIVYQITARGVTPTFSGDNAFSTELEKNELRILEKDHNLHTQITSSSTSYTRSLIALTI